MSEPTPPKPYLVRAMYEWCTDNGFTPHMEVKVFGQVRVPMEFVQDGEIVLNISFAATSGLVMDNEAISFKGRFGGVPRDVYVPIGAIAAIYAGENHQGMAFDVTVETPTKNEIAEVPRDAKPVLSLTVTKSDNTPPDEGSTPKGKGKKPGLTIVK